MADCCSRIASIWEAHISCENLCHCIISIESKLFIYHFLKFKILEFRVHLYILHYTVTFICVNKVEWGERKRVRRGSPSHFPCLVLKGFYSLISTRIQENAFIFQGSFPVPEIYIEYFCQNTCPIDLCFFYLFFFFLLAQRWQ